LTAPDWRTSDFSPSLHDAVVDGRRLRYVDVGEGPALLLVHGLGGCWQWWLENIPALASTSRVIAVDLPGFGESEALPAPGAMETHVGALVALLDQLGLSRVTLVGHSMGGLIAMMFAAAHPERLDGLVPVCAGGVDLGPRRLAAIVRGFLLFQAWFSHPGVTRAFARRPRLRRLMFMGVTGDPSTLSPQLGQVLVERLASGPGFVDAVRSAGATEGGVAAEAIATPSLLVWGSRDPILPVRDARALAERMPDARLEVLEGVGHCPMFERPERFNELLAAFVAQRAATATAA
jgi:pimeloyl-ACP methyl ester carboxylesterase